MSWVAVIRKALEELGGQTDTVVGAKLQQRAEMLADGNEESLSDYLNSQSLKFSDFLATIPGIVVYKQRGSDMLVGFQGATLPQLPTDRAYRDINDRPLALRQDVYLAFTRVSASPWFYVPSMDVFTREPSADVRKLEIPRVTLNTLVEDRKQFAEEIEATEAKDDLLAALYYSGNPLADFQRVVMKLHLGRDWHEFNVKQLLNRIRKWASEQDLPQSNKWTETRESSRILTPQDILVTVARLMSDEEVRELRLPFRVIEALLRQTSK